MSAFTDFQEIAREVLPTATFSKGGRARLKSGETVLYATFLYYEMERARRRYEDRVRSCKLIRIEMKLRGHLCRVEQTIASFKAIFPKVLP